MRFFNSAIDNSKFAHMKLEGIMEECTLSGTKFISVDLTEHVFNRCTFNANTNFDHSNVNGTKFIDCLVNNQPLTHQWLFEKGALNVATAIIDGHTAPIPLMLGRSLGG